jgi:hypothetical protein
MADDVAGLLQEISGILQRISGQNEAKVESSPPKDQEPTVHDHPLQVLQQHNEILDSVIERLKERPKNR